MEAHESEWECERVWECAWDCECECECVYGGCGGVEFSNRNFAASGKACCTSDAPGKDEEMVRVVVMGVLGL